jgi:Ca2+-binding EF-hand superfamily protein
LYPFIQIKPIPIHKTLLLVNNFVVSTSAFINEFAEACETKISGVSSKINELEILLAVLEAKLGSIPGLDSVGAATNLPPLQKEVEVPANLPTVPSAAPEPAVAAAPAPAASAGGPPIKDDPEYAPFFKMLRVGVPMPVVQQKAAASGLDPSLLALDPDSPRPGGAGGGGGGAPANKPLSRIIFDKFDVDNSGDISINELQAMALQFGVWLSGDALEVAMRTIDSNGDGHITYNEFLNWYRNTPGFNSLALDDVTLKRRQALASVFTNYDLDKNGILDRNEFASLHAELVRLGVTRKSLENAIEDIDTNSDGVIQFNELANWLDRN